MCTSLARPRMGYAPKSLLRKKYSIDINDIFPLIIRVILSSSWYLNLQSTLIYSLLFFSRWRSMEIFDFSRQCRHSFHLRFADGSEDEEGECHHCTHYQLQKHTNYTPKIGYVRTRLMFRCNFFSPFNSYNLLFSFITI